MSCLGLGLDMHGRLLSAYVLAGYPTGVEGAQGGPGNNTPPPPPGWTWTVGRRSEQSGRS